MKPDTEFAIWIESLGPEERYLALERAGISLGPLPVTADVLKLCQEQVGRHQAERISRASSEARS